MDSIWGYLFNQHDYNQDPFTHRAMSLIKSGCSNEHEVSYSIRTIGWKYGIGTKCNYKYIIGLYIIPDQLYDMYQDTLQLILITYHDTNFAIF